MSKVSLVTWQCQGLGRNIAEAVLAAGDGLVATAGDPHQLEDLAEQYGDHIRAVGTRRDRVQVILRLADSDRLPAHLLIGSDAVRYAREAEAARAADADRWREVSVSTDFNASAALPALQF